VAAFGLSFEQKSKELKILDEPAKPFEHLKWANGRTPDLATYMKEHPYMYAGDNVRAVFRVAMEQFALNFAPDVTVPEPQCLREKVKSTLKKALEKYE
jgi:predicted DNA-binding transcriptional regulator YafY